MGVALGNADVRVAKDFLDDADVDSLFDKKRGGGVAAVVNSGVADAGLAEE